jgi:dihydroorotate dehydrogenase
MSKPAASTYERLLRPLLFKLDAETTHRLAQFALQRELPWSLLPARVHEGDRLAVTVGDWRLSSPIGLAAGFDKNGDAVPGLQHLGFDHVTIGSILPAPSAGHPRPRLIRYPETQSMANCHGLPSDGLDACVAKFKRLAARGLKTRLIANVYGESVEDYVRCCAALAPYADGIELALRCPNTSDHLALYPVGQLDALIGAARDVSAGRALFVKLPPFTNDAEQRNRLALVERAIHFGLAGVAVQGNWMVTEPRLSQGRGSLSGRATFASNLATVRAVAAAARGRIAVRASGGVFTGADALQMIEAGATMIEIFTAFVYRGWNAAAKIKAEMLALMDQRGIARLSELRLDRGGQSGLA